MAVSSLIKIPLLVVIAACQHKVLTPPTPPADSSETGKYGTQVDTLARGWVRPTARLAKVICWLHTSAETAVILASHYPSSISAEVLTRLVRPSYAPSNVGFTTIWMVGCVTAISGSLIRLASYRELGRFFTWELSIKDDQHLVTTGPYAIVRHPGYTGHIMLMAGTYLFLTGSGGLLRECGWLNVPGVALLVQVWAGILVWVAVMMVVRTGREDRVLKKQFAAEWERYAAKTPYKLLPFVF